MSVLAVLLGFFTASNVAYLFVVGNTPILISYVYGILVLVLLIFRNIRLPSAKRIATRDLLLFLLAVVASIVPLLLFHAGYVERWFNGLIALFLIVIYYTDTVLLFEHRQKIALGVFAGIMLNALFCLYDVYMRRQGVVFTLAVLFPKATTYSQFIGNALRCTGLFQEPGHLMRYLAVTLILMLPYFAKMNKLIQILITIASLFMAAMTRSASLLFAVLGFAFIIFQVSKRHAFRVVMVLLSILLVVIIFLVFTASDTVIGTIQTGFIDGILDFFSRDESNSGRIQAMQVSREFISQYPLIGSGWNTTTSLYSAYGYSTESSHGLYSFILTLIVELGIGAIPIIWFCLQKGVALIRDKRFDYMCTGLALLIYFLIALTTDYTFDPIVSVLFAFVVMHYKTRHLNSNTVSEKK